MTAHDKEALCACSAGFVSGVIFGMLAFVLLLSGCASGPSPNFDYRSELKDDTPAFCAHCQPRLYPIYPNAKPANDAPMNDIWKHSEPASKYDWGETEDREAPRKPHNGWDA